MPTLIDKIWKRHVIRELSDGRTLLHIDRHLIHDGSSRQAFDGLRATFRTVRNPALNFAVVDHIVSTLPGRTGESYPPGQERIRALRVNCIEFGLELYDVDSPRQGIVHVIAPELGIALANNGQPEIRIIGPIYTLKTGFWVRKDSNMRSVADLRGKRVTMGYSAMRALDPMSRAILATGGLTEADIKPVLVPNVVRSADDFVAGAADMFMFAFGAPKVREVDVTVGGTRFLEIPESPGMAAARKVSPYGYLSDVEPGPIFVGVERPMKVYTIDNMLFAHAKVPDDVVYKVIETMEANKAEMIAVAPNLREFSAAGLNKKYDFPYHPGALKYFKDKNIEAKAFP